MWDRSRDTQGDFDFKNFRYSLVGMFVTVLYRQYLVTYVVKLYSDFVFIQ